jgi:hypothetical protein
LAREILNLDINRQAFLLEGVPIVDRIVLLGKTIIDVWYKELTRCSNIN